MTARALPPVWLLVALQGAVSAASLVVEIVAGRMLAPYVGMSLYTWTSVIAVVLAGFSVGHWIGGIIAERQPARALIATGWALAAAALTTAGAVFLLRWGAGFVLPATDNAVTAIVALSMIAFFLPSLFAGIPAPVLAAIAVAAAPDRQGRALGAMFAAGAIGAIAGTLLAGFVFISWLGSIGTLAAVTVGYALATLLLLALGRRAGQTPALALAAGALIAPLALAAASLAAPSPCTVESRYFCLRSLDVSTDPQAPVRLMVLDHLAHGISARDAPGVMHTDHAALLEVIARHRMGTRAFHAFFIGGGTYSIPRAWASRAPRPEMTVAEIDPAVTAMAMADFWFDPEGVEILHEDARRALARRPESYDVIVGDAFTDIAVPQHLITREFFELAASRLAPGGVYLMNVIDHAGSLAALAAILATAEAVFPVVEVWTSAERLDPGAQRVFVLAAGDGASPAGFVETLTPAPKGFGRLPENFLAALRAEHGEMILTDDFAPIDRLLGATF
jgi:predicted O-methyltransferase YrrM